MIQKLYTPAWYLREMFNRGQVKKQSSQRQCPLSQWRVLGDILGHPHLIKAFTLSHAHNVLEAEMETRALLSPGGQTV